MKLYIQNVCFVLPKYKFRPLMNDHDLQVPDCELCIVWYLGSRVGHSMSDVLQETPHISVVNETRNPLRDIIEQTQGVPQEIHRT